ERFERALVRLVRRVPGDRERLEPAARELRGREHAHDGEHDPGADDEQPVANDEPCDVGHREPRLPIPNGPTHVEVVNASVGGRYFLLTEVVAYNRLLRSPHLVEPPHGAAV